MEDAVRIRLDVGYDGTDFHGWAVQPGLRTVEAELCSALTTVLRLPSTDPGVRLTCAGRTDAGVHARGQVVHVDVPGAADVREGLERLVRRLNGVLPADLRVRRARVAPPGFDARFGALSRRYAYRVADAAAYVDPLTRRYVVAWPRPLDLEAMGRAAAPLVGLRDFASFCRRREGATTIRTLLELSWCRGDDGVAVATVRADAFCHSMVRSMVGCLLSIGEGRRPEGWAAEMLAAGRRDPAVKVAPARGLTLEDVVYPPDDQLEARGELTRARRT